MGFGFNLFVIFILFPVTVLILIVWILSKKKIFGIFLGLIWIGVVCLIVTVSLLKRVTSKKVLDKEDYYGEYIIDRNYFAGKQADWQYNHFRFEIKENDSIYFFETDGEKILKTHKGKIATTTIYPSARLVLKMEQPTHHIVLENPTTYRATWSFHLVFHSNKFSSVYFKKGKWKPL